MFIEPADLAAFADIDEAKASAMIEDAEAMAVLAAPCLSELDPTEDAAKVAAVKAVLRGAILRWNDAGAGVITQQGAGPFQQTIDATKTRRGMFWPSEIDQLRRLCSAIDDGDAFTIDTAPSGVQLHPSFCSIYFGGSCSCGIADVGRVYRL